jgi:hypothetical protein
MELRAEMNNRVTRIALLVGFSVVALTTIEPRRLSASPSIQQEQQKKQDPGKDKKDSKNGSSLTGCVDEQDGRYVLVDDQNLNPVANLEADGFPTEGFAKHLGHKVTVRGTSIPGSGRPSFKVRSIETVSETCGHR